MEAKDWVSIIGILATLGVALANLILNIRNNKITTYINTVTAARIDWIENLRDKISSFIALAERFNTSVRPSKPESLETDFRQFDTLLHQIVLYLNPTDPIDQRIKSLVTQSHSWAISDEGDFQPLSELLARLRDATGEYLHKEWNKVKREASHQIPADELL